MVDLARYGELGEGERPQVCSWCGRAGLASEDKSRSSFYVKAERAVSGGPLYRSHCARCDSKRQGEYQRRTRPERLKTRQRYVRAVKADPERRERFEKAQRRARQAYVERLDKGERERYEETQRLSATMRRERRRGRQRKAVLSDAPPSGRVGRKLPAGPFREWLEHLAEREARAHDREPRETIRAVAAIIGVSPRRIYDYRSADFVWEGTVDHACSREGTIMSHELYPQLLEED